jgi:hypothetical protein
VKYFVIHPHGNHSVIWVRVSTLVPASAKCTWPGIETYIQGLYEFLRTAKKICQKHSRQNRGPKEKISNAKNIPAKIEAPRKNSQMPKTFPPKSRHRGKILKCLKHLSLLSSHKFFTSDFCPQIQNTSKAQKLLPPPLQRRVHKKNG